VVTQKGDVEEESALYARRAVFFFGFFFSFLGLSTSVLASILAREPDLGLMPPRLNPRIHDLLRRSLEKESKAPLASHWRSADGAGSRARGPARVVGGGAARHRAEATVDVDCLRGRGGGSNRGGHECRLVVFQTITAKACHSLLRAARGGPAVSNPGRPVAVISPDGTQMVYVANQRLYHRVVIADVSGKGYSGVAV